MGILDKLFGRNQDDQKIFVIDFTSKGLMINEQLIFFPIKISILNTFFGKPELVKTETDTIYIWQENGARGFSKDGQVLSELDIKILKTKQNEYFPQQNFTGTIKIEGNNYLDFVKITKDDYLFKEYSIGDFNLQIRLTKEEPKIIRSISFDKTENIRPTNEAIDKYKTQKVINGKIEFEDFNFKLAIIEELMFTKDLLKPKFDIFEFVKVYDKRQINIELEGYEPIPEVIAYFENLEIDKTLAELVTEIYQDGGNDIYMNIIPHWDGEDDSFDIKSYEDVKHFPNLKKMTLLCTDEKVFEKLKVKGIEAQPL